MLVDSVGHRFPLSVQPEMTLAIGVERRPDQAVEEDYENRHDGDAEHDARKIPRDRHVGDVCAEAMGGEMVVPPGCDFRDDAGVPRAARGRDGTGYVIGEDPWQDRDPPPLPAVKMEV